MLNKVLFIFEGAKTEKQIASSLQKHFVNENTLIECVYGNVIYELYEQINNDKYLDIFSLLKENNPNELKEYTRNDFAEIYLFFDYDGHSHVASDEKLESILQIFDNETENGKLYISYPMVEALKHISDYDAFRDVKIECKKNIRYKSIVNDECKKDFLHFKNYNRQLWILLINCHLKKMNYIANDLFTFPNVIITQQEVFSKQKKKYIDIQNMVSVLSAFPLFIHDYYGNEKTKNILQI